MSDNQIQDPEISPSVPRKRNASGQTVSNQPLAQSSSSNIRVTPQQPAQAASSQASQLPLTVAKIKCQNFLSTLMRLASAQPEQTANIVKTCIQSLIDGAIEPEAFVQRLQRELNSVHQPCLVPFLRRSLPYLRHSLMVREMTIDGVRPPAFGSVPLPVPVPCCHINNSSMAAPMPPVSLARSYSKMLHYFSMRNAIRPSEVNARGIAMAQQNPVNGTVFKMSNEIQDPEISSSIPRKRHAPGQKVSNQTNSPKKRNTPALSVLENASIRIKHLLISLMDKANRESAEKGKKVKDLVQRLIYGLLGTREFIDLLFVEIAFSLTHMAPYIEYLLPYLRYSFMMNELVIDGVQPPLRGSCLYPYPIQPVAQNQANQVPAQVYHVPNQPSGSAHRPNPYLTSKSLNNANMTAKLKKETAINPYINVLNYLASLPQRNDQI